MKTIIKNALEKMKDQKTCKIEGRDIIIFINKDPLDIVDLLFSDIHSKKFYDKSF